MGMFAINSMDDVKRWMQPEVDTTDVSVNEVLSFLMLHAGELQNRVEDAYADADAWESTAQFYKAQVDRVRAIAQQEVDTDADVMTAFGLAKVILAAIKGGE